MKVRWGRFPGICWLGGFIVKKWLIVGLVALSCLHFEQPARAHAVAGFGLGLDIYEMISIIDQDPIGYWRRMRPQDFINAPTVWQVLV